MARCATLVAVMLVMSLTAVFHKGALAVLGVVVGLAMVPLSEQMNVFSNKMDGMVQLGIMCCFVATLLNSLVYVIVEAGLSEIDQEDVVLLLFWQALFGLCIMVLLWLSWTALGLQTLLLPSASERGVLNVPMVQRERERGGDSTITKHAHVCTLAELWFASILLTQRVRFQLGSVFFWQAVLCKGKRERDREREREFFALTFLVFSLCWIYLLRSVGSTVVVPCVVFSTLFNTSLVQGHRAAPRREVQHQCLLVKLFVVRLSGDLSSRQTNHRAKQPLLMSLLSVPNASPLLNWFVVFSVVPNFLLIVS
jgi:hypothetical protein